MAISSEVPPARAVTPAGSKPKRFLNCEASYGRAFFDSIDPIRKFATPLLARLLINCSLIFCAVGTELPHAEIR
jgi:hypothetical protein